MRAGGIDEAQSPQSRSARAAQEKRRLGALHASPAQRLRVRGFRHRVVAISPGLASRSARAGRLALIWRNAPLGPLRQFRDGAEINVETDSS
jgi:hypothetical protein